MPTASMERKNNFVQKGQYDKCEENFDEFTKQLMKITRGERSNSKTPRYYNSETKQERKHRAAAKADNKKSKQ